MMEKTHLALKMVEIERRRQIAKWGEQPHAPTVWLSILTEEVGELAKECNEDLFGDVTAKARMRTEAIQVAAVAVAMVEQLDAEAFAELKAAADAEE